MHICQNVALFKNYCKNSKKIPFFEQCATRLFCYFVRLNYIRAKTPIFSALALKNTEASFVFLARLNYI